MKQPKGRPYVPRGTEVMLIRGWDDQSNTLHVIGRAVCEGWYSIKIKFDEIFQAFEDQLARDIREDEKQMAEQIFNSRTSGRDTILCPKFVTEDGKSIWGFQCHWEVSEIYDLMIAAAEEHDYPLLIIPVAVSEVNPEILEEQEG